jgi:hypothetical protein
MPNSQLVDEFGYLLDEAPPVNGRPGMPQLGGWETSLRPYDPSWREQIASRMMGDAPAASARGDLVGAVMGTKGLGPTGPGGTTFSAVDMMPLAGGALTANEQAQKGNRVRAVASLIPYSTVAGALAKPALKYATPIASDLAELMRSMGRGM